MKKLNWYFERNVSVVKENSFNREQGSITVLLKATSWPSDDYTTNYGCDRKRLLKYNRKIELRVWNYFSIIIFKSMKSFYIIYAFLILKRYFFT